MKRYKSKAEEIFERALKRTSFKSTSSKGKFRVTRTSTVPRFPGRTSPRIGKIPSFEGHVGEPIPGTTTGGEPSTPEAEPPTRESGIVILEGTQQHPPHTKTDSSGRFVDTDRWFDSVFLCYDASLPVNARGGRDDPYLGIHGREFSVYYPNSTRADWRAILTSGSSGRWLSSWSQKGNYIRI